MITIPHSIKTALETGDISKVLSASITHFDCQAGTIHRLQDQVLKLAAHINIPEQVVQIVSTVPVGKGIAGLAAERQEPITICNLQTDTSGQARPGAKATGMEGSLAVPIITGTELKGVLGIAKASAYDWSKGETDLLLQIAERCGHLFN